MHNPINSGTFNSCKHDSKGFQTGLFLHYFSNLLIGLLILGLISQKINAQNDTTGFKRNTIFFELGGAGGSHSMNYERLFKLMPKMAFSGRVGIGFDNLVDYRGKINPNIVMPFMAGLMYGNNHKIELGLGQTIANTIETDINTGDPTRKTSASTTFNICYRYQNPAKNILVRVGYTPFIEYNVTYKHWAGASIGFLF